MNECDENDYTIKWHYYSIKNEKWMKLMQNYNNYITNITCIN